MQNPTPKFQVSFDRELHLYTYEGKPVDHVTKVLKQWAFGYDDSNPFHEPSATQRGSYLARCNEVFADGDDVDEEEAPEAWRGYIAALRKFYHDRRPKVIACELPIVDPVWGIALTPDLVAFFGSERVVCEMKTGAHNGWDIQNAAQIHVWGVNFPDQPCRAGKRLQLKPDGDYRLVQLDYDTAMGDFAAMMRLEQRRRRNGG